MEMPLRKSDCLIWTTCTKSLTQKVTVGFKAGDLKVLFKAKSSMECKIRLLQAHKRLLASR